MYEIQTLPNGVRIVTCPMKGYRSAALGFWVGAGSRQETPEENGATHFIEHMVFKGTQERSAADLAEEMDAIGGQFNAFTTKECTCFHARGLDSHLPRATDVLCDMFFRSKFDEEDVKTERGVILEEIGMYEDNPEDLSAEQLYDKVYAGDALARPILGTKKSLAPMTGKWLKEYMAAHYLPQDIVLSLAGSYTDDDVKRLADAFGGLTGGRNPAPKPPKYTPSITAKEKPIEQNHLTLAFPSLPYGSDERYALQLLSTVLGAGMSSRLFQRVREEKGLCYSIYSYGAGHADTGLFCVYTALGKDTEADAIQTILEVVREVADKGITKEEMERAREQSKANVVMGLESTQSLMSHMGRSLLLTGDITTPEEIIKNYDAVTGDQVKDLARRIFDFDAVSLSAVGQTRAPEEYKKLLGL